MIEDHLLSLSEREQEGTLRDLARLKHRVNAETDLHKQLFPYIPGERPGQAGEVQPCTRH